MIGGTTTAPSTALPSIQSRARTTGTPEVSLGVREVLRLPVFWGLLLCIVVPPLVQTAVIFHQVALFSAVGWGEALVPPAFMAYALGGVVMTYATGLLLERIPSRFGISLAAVLVAANGSFGRPLALFGAACAAAAVASLWLHKPALLAAPVSGLDQDAGDRRAPATKGRAA